MLSNLPFSKELSVPKLLVWLFNVSLVIIFLCWVIIDGLVYMLKKFMGKISGKERRTEMKNRRLELKPVFLAGLAAALFIIFSIPAKAGEDVSHIEARKLQAAGEILSLEKIAEIARTIKPGDILETELERSRKSGIYIYEIEILDAKGVVWELDINAKTGELIKIEIDD